MDRLRVVMSRRIHRGCRFVMGLLVGLSAALLVSAPLIGADAADLSKNDDAAIAVRVDQLLGNKQYEDAAYAADQLSDDQSRDEFMSRVAREQIGAAGGGTQADFDTLIELIKSTVDPESWDDNGGTGAAQGFPGGVYVDPQGVLKRITVKRENNKPSSASTISGNDQERARAATDSGNRDAAVVSKLRKVSLTRLERRAQLSRVLGQPLPDDVRYLAGISRIEYVFVYPETGDLVIAGPAGPWHRDEEGRPVSSTTNEPILQLDDFVVLLRNAYSDDGRFTCSITPKTENLQATQTFLASSRDKPLRPGQRKQWLADLRAQVGRQRIDVTGIDAATRAAKVIVEADYRMKLVGMGLEPAVPGVTSYLDLIEVDANGQLPDLEVLRWWFTLDEKGITTNDARDLFAFTGQGVVVLSENELLTRLGQRVHTGKAEPWNQQFTQSFTEHFAELAQKYPIYADLRNIFDWALVANLIRHEDLPSRIDWHMTYFGDHHTGKGLKYAVEGQFVPREVETVVNHRQVNQRQFVAGVSGGVSVDANRMTTRENIKRGNNQELTDQHQSASPNAIPRNIWWWD